MPASRALDWYAWALRLWKRAPWPLSAIALAVFLLDFGLRLVPGAGNVLGQALTPLFACGLIVSTHRLVRGGEARFSDLLVAFASGIGTIAALIVADLATFAVQWGGMLLATGTDIAGDLQQSPDALEVASLFALGMLGSLPFTLVPFEALFARRGFAASFATSFAAFARNVPVLLHYALLSFLLALVVLLTMGAAAVIVMPLWAASSYAAWRDLAPPASLEAADAGGAPGTGGDGISGG